MTVAKLIELLNLVDNQDLEVVVKTQDNSNIKEIAIDRDSAGEFVKIICYE